MVLSLDDGSGSVQLFQQRPFDGMVVWRFHGVNGDVGNSFANFGN